MTRHGWRLVLAMFALAANAPAEAVRVWQGTLTLPTYEEGEPDPNPPFDQYASTNFSYPYTLRQNLTAKSVPHAWRAIYLENQYLRCSVLPDLGGHVYTCVDKVSGRPMFYANPSIKKANIGYRGAWAAFGIEFNFPVSHNWVSMSPVPFSTRTMADGSAVVTVGNVVQRRGDALMVAFNANGVFPGAHITVKDGERRTHFEQALLLPDRAMAHHLSRLALE